MTPRISIAKINGQEEASSALLSQRELHERQVRDRAYRRFERRGRTPGNEWDDWLREMFRNASAIIVRAAVPGLGPKSVQVTATPHSLMVLGAEPHSHESLEGRLHFCEFGHRLFRRFDLPARIGPNRVSATLDKGILEIFAGLARQPEAPPDAAKLDVAPPDPAETGEPCPLSD